jgi:nitrate reductase gamma subunit
LESHMNGIRYFAYVIYPYLALTLFAVGHPFRYSTDYYKWNAKSSELLDKAGLKWPIIIFHWGILGTLFGHAGGLLIPQWFFDIFGFSASRHNFVSHWVGLVVGLAAFFGITLLIVRRFVNLRVRSTTSQMDWLVDALIFIITGIGIYNVVFAETDILFNISPWIRSIITFTPDPDLLRNVPFSFKLHILLAFALFAISPFTRLVHIWSVPITYLTRRYIIYRRRMPDEAAPF